MSIALNKDRLEIIDEIYTEVLKRGYDISKEDITTSIEDFEALLLTKVPKPMSNPYRWTINNLLELFTTFSKERNIKKNDLMSKTFNEIFVRLCK